MAAVCVAPRAVTAGPALVRPCQATVAMDRPLPMAPASGPQALRAAAVDDPSHRQALPAQQAGRDGTPLHVAAAGRALDEMLRGAAGRVLRWDRVPELVVLMSVMEYHADARTNHRATSEVLTEDEAADLVADLTQALRVLTADTMTSFAAVRREAVLPGASAAVLRPGAIVVGRYRGIRDALDTIGLGGRSERQGTIRGGTIMLDRDYDRTSSLRRLLRAHELGHALGYNHVASEASIMNPRIGTEPTAFDRQAAAVAMGDAGLPAGCNDPLRTAGLPERTRP